MTIPAYTIKSGSVGAVARAVQTALGVTADGQFGPASVAALTAWQTAHGLTADGVCGPKTAAALGVQWPVLVIDVSHYQGVVDWQAVKDGGVAGVIVKTTQGGGGHDNQAATNVMGAKGVGLPVLVYHFCDLSKTPQANAVNLLDSVQKFAPTHLVALDFETDRAGESVGAWFARCGHTATSAAQWCNDFADALPGRELWYGMGETLHALLPHGLDASRFAGVWLARYSGRTDDPETDTGAMPLAMWQWTSGATIPGVPVECDASWCFVPLDSLRRACS